MRRSFGETVYATSVRRAISLRHGGRIFRERIDLIVASSPHSPVFQAMFSFSPVSKSSKQCGAHARTNRRPVRTPRSAEPTDHESRHERQAHWTQGCGTTGGRNDRATLARRPSCTPVADVGAIPALESRTRSAGRIMRRGTLVRGAAAQLFRNLIRFSGSPTAFIILKSAMQRTSCDSFMGGTHGNRDNTIQTPTAPTRPAHLDRRRGVCGLWLQLHTPGCDGLTARS
jgi:hypothetical protein